MRFDIYMKLPCKDVKYLENLKPWGGTLEKWGGGQILPSPFPPRFLEMLYLYPWERLSGVGVGSRLITSNTVSLVLS